MTGSLDTSTQSLLAAMDALLEAIRRLTVLAERLRVRAESGPRLTAIEDADARHELAIARESVAKLEGHVLLLRQGMRPM